MMNLTEKLPNTKELFVDFFYLFLLHPYIDKDIRSESFTHL